MVTAVHQYLQIVYVVRLRARNSSIFFGKEVLVLFVSRSVTVSHNLLIPKNVVLSFRRERSMHECHTLNDTKVYSEMVIHCLAPKQRRDISRVVHTINESRSLDKKQEIHAMTSS